MTTPVQVSVLIPVYKAEKQIERCAKHLFEQTFDSIEFVFADDASPDNSMKKLQDMLDRYPARKDFVKIIRHNRNRGIGKTRLDLLFSASGKYIVWCDADDYLAPDAVEKLFHAAEDGNADIVSSNFRDVFADGSIKERKRFSMERDCFLKRMLQGKELPYLFLIFARRDLYMKNRCFPYTGVNYGEDYGLVPRLLFHAKKIVFLPDVFYSYVHENPQSNCSCWKSSYPEERTRIYEKNELFWEPQYHQDLRLNKIHEKCDFYRIYALSDHPGKEELIKINSWCPEISFLSLIREARLPYIPLILLAYMRLPGLMSLYASVCRDLYRWQIRMKSV